MRNVLFLIMILCGISEVAAAFSWWPFADMQKTAATAVPAVKGNRHSQSFYAVKKEMLAKVYFDHKQTLYCNAAWNARKKIITPRGFKLPDVRKVDFKVYDISVAELRDKAERMEWEHIVPAQNFGKTFSEWSDGHKNCTFGKGQKFKGRKCAEQENAEFRYMYADMYNLYPSIGAVNYLRSNFNFAQLGAAVKPTFGSCEMKISRNKAEPPDAVKGLIARTYLYMRRTYPRYSIGEPMLSVLQAWDKKYPPTAWECVRAYRIEKVQGNADTALKKVCVSKNLYHD